MYTLRFHETLEGGSSMYPPTTPPTAHGQALGPEAELNTHSYMGGWGYAAGGAASIFSTRNTNPLFTSGHPFLGPLAQHSAVARSAITWGVPMQQQPSQLLSGTAMATVSWPHTTVLYVQDIHTAVRELRHAQANTAPDFLKVFNRGCPSPLASIHWVDGNTRHLRIYTIDSQNTIREAGHSSSNPTWSAWELDQMRIRPLPESKLASVMVPGAIHLYYQDDNDRMVYYQRLRSNQWRWSEGLTLPVFTNAAPGTPIAAVAWGDLNVRLFCLDSGCRIFHCSFAGSILGSGRWTMELVCVSVREDSPLAAIQWTDNQNVSHVRVYYIDRFDGIQELCWDNSRYRVGFLSRYRVLAAPGSSLAATRDGNSIRVFYQAPGDEATICQHVSSHINPNSWSPGPALTPRAD
ncbi:uncharacterized protein H6S33_008227 [Morchella sextelata]|uniref:uncharacterized protein n=1 Tax=Morchella sextelata TaxID=1174677 RepID=UPI001D051307|nr:uncharacterized protein H6S33_008227 [Morchella sextelata]KAH0603223.1 hypothetical protein H6S33_008227 [Morchella sextelata]